MSVLDLAPAEDATLVGEPVCHLYDRYGTAPESLCGYPRSAQPPHSVRWSQIAPVCTGCGRRRCARCRDLHLGRAHRG